MNEKKKRGRPFGARNSAYKPARGRVTLRLSQGALETAKARALGFGVTYTRLLEVYLESALGSPETKPE